MTIVHGVVTHSAECRGEVPVARVAAGHRIHRMISAELQVTEARS
jgi:hypothetical protein